MWARVSTYEFPVERVDEGIDRFNEATERLKGLEGIRRAYLLVDRNRGKAMTITVWESEEGLRQSEEAAGRLRSESSESAGGTVLETGSYELAVQEDFES